MALTYRPFDRSDADFEALVAINNTESDVRRSAEEAKEMDKLLEPGRFFLQEFIALDGEVVGVAAHMEAYMVETPGVYEMGYSLLPDWRGKGLEPQILARLLEGVRERGALQAMCTVKDQRAERIKALEDAGFELAMRDPVTAVDLEGFQAADYEGALEQVRQQGIVLKTVAEIEAEGVDWMRPTYELFWELLQDVPMPEPMRHFSFEEFSKWVQNPFMLNTACWIIGFDGDKWVGSSDLHPMPAQPDTAMTGLTGVVRSHRRRGIATALKVTALEQARKAGVRSVRTGNEENNPMLQLNKRLGFREQFAMLTYRKDLTA